MKTYGSPCSEVIDDAEVNLSTSYLDGLPVPFAKRITDGHDADPGFEVHSRTEADRSASSGA
ncbi:MAG: hypothetical protein ACKO7B_16455, partial [Flavobacteriales bacterium]